MDDISILSDELRNDPLNRGYASMTDDQAAADLNLDYRAYSVDILVDEFEYVMRVSNKWLEYRSRADDPTNNPGMAELMDVFATRIVQVDLREHENRIAKEQILPYWSALLDSCVAEGSLGTFAAEEARKLCDSTVTRAWELIDRRATAADVGKARAQS